MPKHVNYVYDTALVGTNSSDQLFGTSGNDYIQGKGGIDYINGGAGDDTITGGSGQDQFGFNPGGGHDVITDYQSGEMLFFNFGMFTNNPGDPIHDGSAHNLSVGEQLTTQAGHVMTVGETAGGDATLTWDTGDSVTLQGVHAAQLSTSVFQFYPSDWVL